MKILLAWMLLCAAGADEDGFTSIFDGKSLSGWHVLPKDRTGDWSVRDGVIVGSGNGKESHLLWQEDDLGALELKLS